MSVQRRLFAVFVAGAVLLVVGATVVGAGGPVGSDFLINSGTHDQVHPAIAYSLEWQQYLVVWQNDRPANDDIYAQRLRADGRLIGPQFTVAGPGAERRYPDVAYNLQRNEYLVVWEQDDGSFYRIRGQRVAASGGLLGPVIEISSGAALKHCRYPAVAYASTSDKYLVVWQRHVQASVSDDIEAQVLSSAGAPQGSNFSIQNGTWQYSHERPDVAYNRSRNEYLVVWQWLNKSANEYDIYGRLVTGNGTVLPGPFAVDASSLDETNPAVAAIPTVPDEGRYFVAWQSPNLGQDIYGRRLKADGSQDGFPHWLSTGSLNDTEPSVAGSEGGREFLVAWTHAWGGGAHSNVYARTVALEGSALGPETDVGGGVSGWASDAAAVAAGRLSDFLVAYQDIGTYSTDPDIYGRLWGIRVYLPLVTR